MQTLNQGNNEQISRGLIETPDVDVDLDDFDDDDLIAHLQGKGISGIPGDLHEQRQAMLRALWDNDEPKAIELLKTYLCDCMGRATI